MKTIFPLVMLSVLSTSALADRTGGASFTGLIGNDLIRASGTAKGPSVAPIACYSTEIKTGGIRGPHCKTVVKIIVPNYEPANGANKKEITKEFTENTPQQKYLFIDRRGVGTPGSYRRINNPIISFVDITGSKSWEWRDKRCVFKILCYTFVNMNSNTLP